MTSTTNLNLATLTSAQGFSFTGIEAQTDTGYSVNGIGDFNNDGYDDIIIGAPLTSSSTGESYVIYGSESLNSIDLSDLGSQGFSITGAPSSSQLGLSVSSAGDINGDGYYDIIIGAPFYSTDTGIVYVIYGGASLSNIDLTSLGDSGFSITGEGTDYQTGYSVSTAGDVNGDGYDDFIIGAPGFSDSTGVTYLIYGGASLPDTIDLVTVDDKSQLQWISIVGTENSCSTGTSVSGVGDINGDNIPDMLIGAPGCSSDTGEVYLIYGGATLSDIDLSNLDDLGISITGEGTDYQTGYSVSTAGDVNGDGYEDMIIGAPKYDSSTGISYLIYGGSSLSSIDLSSLESNQGFSIIGISSGWGVGFSVSGAGDINGDGYDDLIIGAPYYNTEDIEETNTGIVYVIYGAASGFVTPNPTLNPATYPTGVPSSEPTGSPSSEPTNQPTAYPSSQPSCLPSTEPTSYPSTKPSSYPTNQPSVHPSSQPSVKPTSQPSSKPSSHPTQPTSHPSYKPSNQPTSKPTGQPSTQPSSRPSNQPSARPTSHPSQPTAQPSSKPSCRPSAQPSSSPSEQPTAKPSGQPSNQPSSKPSSQPSSKPTSTPTQPSICPSAQPTSTPSGQPSSQPSQPSSEPSGQPSSEPSSQPSSQPTQPSSQPSSQPSANPSVQPSAQPSGKPTNQPTGLPTNNPSSKPSVFPSAQPSINPSSQPTTQPTFYPTAKPSASPSLHPSSQPSAQPTGQPTIQPTSSPTAQPSASPSLRPSGQPSTQPTDQPTIQPTTSPSPQPSASPSSHPSVQPSNQPSTQPTSQPSTKPSESPSSQPSHKPTSQPSTQPTSQPTSVPSMSPSEPRVLVINENENILNSIASGVSSFIGAVALYFGPSIILSDWGYKYKAIYFDADKENLKENEIGLYLDDGKLLALHKKNIYKIEINNGNNNGISQGLYKVITNKLNKISTNYKYIYNNLEKQNLAEKQIGIQYHKSNSLSNLFCNNGRLVLYKKNTHSDLIEEHEIQIGDERNNGIPRGLFDSIVKEYNTLSTHLLLVSEENQLRDFLLIKERIYPNTYIPIYTDLGYLQGFIYTCCLMLKKYQRSPSNRISEESFSKIELVVQVNMGLSPRQESKDSYRERQISMKDLFQNNADLPYDFARSSNPMLYLADNNNIRFSRQEEVSVANNQQQNFGIDSTNSVIRESVINAKYKNTELLCIDALMDQEYVRLLNTKFAQFSQHLMLAYKDLNMFFSNTADKTQKLLGYVLPEETFSAVRYQASYVNKPYFSASSSNLVVSLLITKQLIEYLPIIQYTTQNTINYLDYNITLLDVLDYKTLLISTHIVLGNAAALLLPAESITNGIIASTIDSSSYAIRLEAIDYLKHQEVADNPVDLVKQCGLSIAAYTLPNLATCAMTKLMLPAIPCAITGLDVLTSGSLGAIQCYSNYKVMAQPSKPTTTDIIIPYIADALVAYTLIGCVGLDTSSSTALMLSIKSSMSVMAAVVAVDSMSRIVMDVIPSELKESYIEPMVDYAYDFASYGINEVGQVIGTVQSCFVD